MNNNSPESSQPTPSEQPPPTIQNMDSVLAPAHYTSTQGIQPGVQRAQVCRRRWTSAEDERLKCLVKSYGDARGSKGRWKDISACIPGRTPKDCRKRWFHSLDPSLRKGRWTEQEDRSLQDAYARLGPAWHDIALLIPGRKDDQCSKRYNEIIGASAKTRLREWSEDEDQILAEGVRALGNRWAAISARLANRPPLTCRNRWRHLSEKIRLPRAPDASDSQPGSTASADGALTESDQIRPSTVAPPETADGGDHDAFGRLSTLRDYDPPINQDDFMALLSPPIDEPLLFSFTDPFGPDGTGPTSLASPHPTPSSTEPYTSTDYESTDNAQVFPRAPTQVPHDLESSAEASAMGHVDVASPNRRPEAPNTPLALYEVSPTAHDNSNLDTTNNSASTAMTTHSGMITDQKDGLVHHYHHHYHHYHHYYHHHHHHHYSQT